jgi:hypothetical protein
VLTIRHRAALALALLCAPLAAQADPVTIITLLTLAAPLVVGGEVLLLTLIALQVAGAAIGRRKARSQAARARAEANARLEDRSATLLQSEPPWPVIYGRCIVGGSVVAIFTSDKTGYREDGSTYTKPDALKHLVIVLAAHEVQAINEVYIEGVALGALDVDGWVTQGEFYAAGRPDSRSVWVGAGTFLDVPEAVVTVLNAYYTTGVGVDTIYIAVTPTLSVGNTRITNPDVVNGITVDYTIAHDSTRKAGVRVSKHLGAAAQTVDTYLNGEVPTQWTSDHRLRGLAYVVMTLDLEEPRFQGGPPQMTFDVSGKPIYDPRTATTAWSNNPALVARDWLIAKWGYEVDSADIEDTACNAAANACEVRQLAATQGHAATFTADDAADTVTFASDMWFGLGDGLRFTTTGTLPGGLALATTYYTIPQTDRRTFKLANTRAAAFAGTVRNITGAAGTGVHTGTWYDYDTYACDGAFNSDAAREAVLDDIVDCMAGTATYGATWRINAGAWTASVMTLTDDDLHGQIEIVQAGAGIDALFNSMRASYIAAGKSSPTDADPYSNPTFVTADGAELWQDVTLPYTVNKARARNLLRIFTERNRDGLMIRYPAKLKAWPLEVGDRVTVTSVEYGFSAKTFRVTDWQFSSTTAVELTLQEDIAAIYDLADAASPDPAPNTALPSPWSVASLAGVTAISDSATVQISAGSAIVPRVLVEWAAVADAYVADGSGRIEILWRRPTGPWQQVNVPGDSTSVYLVGPNHGDRIVIEARARNGLGKAGPSTFVAHTVAGAALFGSTDPGNFFDGFEDAQTLDRWRNYSGSGERSVVSVIDAGSGGNILRVGNNSGNDQAYLIHSGNIPFDPTALYRVKARLRRTAGSGTAYVGLAGVDADGSTFVNSTGAASISSQHYIAANAASPASSWTEYTGYVRGVDTTGTTTARADPSAPGVLHEDVRYIRPLVVVNYSGVAGTTEVDHVSIERLGGAIGTDDLGEDAATELLTDVYDFAGAAYGTSTARTVNFTPAADCRIELTATLEAARIDGDAAHYVSWYVSVGGGADTLVVGFPGNDVTTTRHLYSAVAEYAATGGVALAFKLKTSRPAFDPDILLYTSTLRLTAVKK